MRDKIIFNDEEDAKVFLKMVLPQRYLLCDAPLLYEILNNIKHNGYIQKSAVKQAEEMHNRHWEI